MGVWHAGERKLHEDLAADRESRVERSVWSRDHV